MLFFFPALFLFDNNVFEACKRLVSIEAVVLCALDIEGISEGATVDSFQCLLHPFLFVLLWYIVSPLGGSLEVHLCSLLGDVVCGLITASSVSCCPSPLVNLLLSVLSPYLLVTSVVLYGRGLLKTA